MEKHTIHTIPALEDNYIFAIELCGGGLAIVDPGEAKTVQKFLNQSNQDLKFILCTHHHWDHVGGIEELKVQTGAKVIAAASDQHRIPAVDIIVEENKICDVMGAGADSFLVMNVSGHTLGHVAFYFKERRTLFAGDALFAMGCGRLFEGKPEHALASLERIKKLPEGTMIYCGHEYTEHNANFAMQYEAGNQALVERVAKIKQLRTDGHATVPFALAEELATNPFLRVDSEEIRKSIGLDSEASAEVVFAKLRQLRNNF